MRDEFGQERAGVRTREIVIATLFLVVVGVATWAVALPALDQDSAKDDPTTTPAAPQQPKSE